MVITVLAVLAAVACGCTAAVLLAIRHAVLAWRLRRIDGRVSRVLDVAERENIAYCRGNRKSPERFL
jgi:hypothetical protein